MYHVWDGSQWTSQPAIKIWDGMAWRKTYKFKVRDSQSWLPRSISDNDDAVLLRWVTEAPTPPPPPPPITHPVPDLNLKTLLEVENLLDPLNFTYSVVDYVVTSDNTKDDKVVIDSQFPAAGQLLAEGSNVTIKLYNFVQPTTTVPNIENILTTQANTAIVNAGLVVGTPIETIETYDINLIGKTAIGTQFPPAGTTVDVGTSVIYDYYIQKPFTTVPDLVGDDESTIFSQLSAANLTIGDRTTFATSNSALDNKIKSTFPVAGTQVQQGSEVDYVVYDKTLSVVPSLNGLTQTQAESALQLAGLYVGTITNQETTVVADEGNVKNNSQSPSAGVEAATGSTVNFTVWVPNTTIAVPNVVGLNAFTAADLLQNTYELYNTIRTTTYTNDPNLEYKITAQSPAAGTVVNIWSTVQIDVYFPYPKYTVPSIIGQTPQTSGTTINTNFTWGSNTLAGTATETTTNFGKVATQSPSAGSEAVAGAINYGVYTDGRPIVPNVVGQAEATAKTNINNVGLNYSVTYQNQTYNGQATAGTVASQSPASGSRLASGGTVSIVVWNAYVPQPVTRTGTVTIGYAGDIPLRWVASYRDTEANISGLTDGGLRTTTAPYYYGYFSTTNGKQHIAMTFNYTDFYNKAFQVSGGAGWGIQSVSFRFWANGGIGNANAKSLRIGSYPVSNVASAPSVMRESDISKIGTVLSINSNNNYGYVNLPGLVINDCFVSPIYPLVVYAPDLSYDNYGSNDGDLRFTVTIVWTEYV